MNIKILEILAKVLLFLFFVNSWFTDLSIVMALNPDFMKTVSNIGIKKSLDIFTVFLAGYLIAKLKLKAFFSESRLTITIIKCAKCQESA